MDFRISVLPASKQHCGGRHGADMVADMEVHMMAAMEVDKVADKVADIVDC